MRNTILLLILVTLSLGLHAEGPAKTISRSSDATKRTDVVKNLDSKRWKRGFIVTLKGDTLQGKIKGLDFFDVYYDYQSLVSFQDAKGVSQYRPEDIRSFSFFDDKNSTVTLQAVSSPDGTGLAFLRLYYSGVCKVYGITKIEVSAVPGSRDEPAQPSFIRNERKFLQVSNSQFYPLKRAGFKKNMREVFAAYPRIVAGLDSKQYTYDKWEDLVKDYNSGTHEEMSASK